MNRRMCTAHGLALLVFGGLAGCASGVGSTPTAHSLYLPGTSTITMMPNTEPYRKTIAAPIEQVWPYVPGAYDSLMIPLTTLQPKTHVVGNEGFKVRQTLGKERLSKFFDCGPTQGGGENADTFELQIVIITQLEADGPSMTKLTTTVQAVGKPLQVSQDYSQCLSKNVLETRLTDIIRSHLAK